MIDLLPYFRGAGKPYYLTNNWGEGPELLHTLVEGSSLYLVKNRNVEHRYHDDHHIYFGLDTSAGADEVYIQRTGAAYGAAWLKRYMAVGDVFLRQPTVTHYRKRDGRVLRTGQINDYIRFHARHADWTSAGGVKLDSVIELHWLTNLNANPERYWFAENVGLVQWRGESGRQSTITQFVDAEPMPYERLSWFSVPDDRYFAPGWKKARIRSSAVSTNIRQLATTSSAVVGLLEDWRDCEVQEPVNGWIRVNFGSLDAFVSQAWATVEDRVEQPAPQVLIRLPEIAAPDTLNRDWLAAALRVYADAIEQGKFVIGQR